MKKYISYLAAAAAFSSAAHAEPFDGASGGFSFGHDNFEVSADDIDVDVFEGSADGLSANGVAGGIFLGYDHSFGSGFVGLETSFGYTGADMTASATDGVDTISAEAEARESWGVSGRAGFRLGDNTGIYARVGYVNTNFKVSYTENGATVSDSDHKGAFLYGGGLESYISDKLSLRAEYSIADYGDADLGEGFSVKNSNFRAVLAYHF